VYIGFTGQLSMGEKKGGGFNYFCLNWGQPQTEKYMQWAIPICFNTFLLIFNLSTLAFIVSHKIFHLF
jgi:hypothetical protein